MGLSDLPHRSTFQLDPCHATALRPLALHCGGTPESEWEGSLDPWTVNTISLLPAVLSAAYFVTAAVASAIGFTGIVKVSRSFPLVMFFFPGRQLIVSGHRVSQGIPAYLRFYRDFSVADFAFCTISTVFVTYTSFSCYSIRSMICEELSRHGDLMRDLAEIGLSPENCEQWFERAVLVFVCRHVYHHRLTGEQRLGSPSLLLCSRF